jgi:predicted nuclease of restriction endonuclease-like (RecB) superfamily
MSIEKYQSDITALSKQITDLISNSKRRISQNINQEILKTYWEVGKLIFERETKYGLDKETNSTLLLELSKTLSIQVGKGFSRSNMTYMRFFYLLYPNGINIQSTLSWSHYIEFLKIDDSLERGFYEQQSILEKWSVRELRRQKDSALFQRLALSNLGFANF